MIDPTDGRPLSDRFIDRLLGWWDVGGGRRIRRAVRGAIAAAGTKLRTTCAPLMARPVVAKTLAKTVAVSAAGFTAVRRWLAKAFANDVPAPQREEKRLAVTADAKIDAKVDARTDVAPAPTRPAIAARSATAEIRTPLRSATAEIRTPTGSGTGEIRRRTATAITKPVVAPVGSPTPTATALTTTLRCWSCLQRNRVRAPRRGGCFLCSSCNQTMLVVDAKIGLTCAVGQAETRGITFSRQANETDPG